MNNPEKAGEALSPEPEPSDSHGEGHSSGKPGRSLQTILNRLVLFCVGPLLVLAVFLGVIGLLDRQSDRDIAASNLAKNFQLAVDQHLQARISALQMLANSTLVDDSARWEDLYGEARGFLEGFGSHVILADLKMRMLINTRVPFGSVLPSLPPSKGKAAAPVALETGKPAVGDIVLGPIAKEPLVAIAVPSLRGGKVTHLLLTTFETRQFQERIDKVALPEGWSLSLLDGNNEPIARRGPEIPDKEKNDPTPILFSAPSTISSWTVVLEIPKIMHHRPLLPTPKPV